MIALHCMSVYSMSIESNKMETHHHRRHHKHSPNMWKILGQTVKTEQNDDDDNHMPNDKHNEIENTHVTKIPSNCPKCQNRPEIRMTEEELTELRIEYVKNQILKKLKLTERPQVSVSGGLPKPVAEGATFLSDSDDDSITGIPDEFYGKTTQKIIFPQLDSEHCRDLDEIGSSMCFSIQIPADIDHNDVESAELWVYKEPHVMDTNKHSFLIGEVETWDSKEEWVKIDIAWKIKNWIEENDLEHVIDISCNTCEKHPSMDMLSLDQGYRPFIVINTHPRRKIKRQRRSVNCSPGVTECCREKLYISFADIGWDDWILYPPGYHAYFCRGSCGTAAAITLSGSYYNSVIRKYMIQRNNSKSKSLELIPCCTATQFSSLQLAYMESNNSATQKTLPNMVVEACGCM
ncbi:Inhibin beta B chain [Pseudolycoriella hygida]|uniref:Inhibin beta B chain n=1 Tax=Pseudolycoriella hygida TaxID=35572 RepID=A0A9Q0S3A1_9DIPT|nr:Inhibin beta B chain [Pseudolycoriella hygida]